VHEPIFFKKDGWNFVRRLLCHPLMRYVQSILLVLLISLVSIPIHWVIEPVNLVMLYLAAVVVAALFLGRGPAILASLLSVLTFDFFLVEPRLSFTVADSQYLLTFMGLLMVGLVISNSAALLRDQVQALRSREAHLDALNSLSRELTRAINLEEMLQSVVTHVDNVFNHPVAILLPGKDGLQSVAASRNLALGADDLEAAMRSYHQRCPTGEGTDILPGTALFFLPLETALGSVGVIGMAAQPAPPASRLSSVNSWMVLPRWPRWPSNGRAWPSKPVRLRSWRTPSACRPPF
jgi:two-component system sensor histidine kinase KdpD